ncbi:YceI family protein [Burkholderia sp. A1]|uniref:YceI family protein n=1 Tax=Burkholderia sp. A1 TaxID=148446 RepID=UPI0005B81F96|nr:YceI family protein [Burkholderia sp. A1]
MAWQSGARWRALIGGLGLALATACTPVAVVTHHVSTATEKVPVGRYTLDPHHWSVSFDVSHFGYSRFTMRFDKASAVLDWRAGGPAMSQVSATIDASSLDTNVPILDRMVTGSDALDAARYPSIRFDSTGWTPTGENTGKLAGNLTIRGTTKPITLAVTFNGYGRNPLTKQPTVGFSASGSFSRAAFDIPTWYPAVGDDVRVRIEAEFEMPPAGSDGAASPAQ